VTVPRRRLDRRVRHRPGAAARPAARRPRRGGHGRHLRRRAPRAPRGAGARSSAARERTGRRSVLVTFHPHPLRIVRPEPRRRCSPPPRRRRRSWPSRAWSTPSSSPSRGRCSSTPPAASSRRSCSAARDEELVIGYDHGFGRDREGTVETMRELGAELGFAVDVVGEVRVDGSRSPPPASAARSPRATSWPPRAARPALLAAGPGGPRRCSAAASSASPPPTSRRRPGQAAPAGGVYAVYGWVGGERVPASCTSGPAPPSAASPPSVELHLLDWTATSTAASCGSSSAPAPRDPPFASAAALVAQMREDGRGAGRARPRSGGRAGRGLCRTHAAGVRREPHPECGWRFN
jgi:riboflavin kinase / FMN adenylyltransferase